MNQIGFEFVGRKAALPTSSNLAMALHNWRGTENGDCKIDDIIYKSSARDIDRPKEIQELIELLVPANCYITLRSQKFKNDEDLKTEKYYQS